MHFCFVTYLEVTYGRKSLNRTDKGALERAHVLAASFVTCLVQNKGECCAELHRSFVINICHQLFTLFPSNALF